MYYHLQFSKQALKDVDFYKKSGSKSILKKLFVLFNELAEHPFTGTGNPEQLKYNLSGLWSRRINREHRLVYEVAENNVLIHSVKGHYY